MTSYLQHIFNEQAMAAKRDIERLQRDAASKIKRDKNCNRLYCETPLETQVEDLMLTLPPAQQYRPWSMQELVALLKGKFRERPAPWCIAVALKKLGWSHRRLWQQYGGRRYWLHPKAALLP